MSLKKVLLGALLLGMMGSAVAVQPVNDCGNRGNNCGKVPKAGGGTTPSVVGGNGVGTGIGGNSNAVSSATGTGGTSSSVSQGGAGGSATATGGNSLAQGGNATGGDAAGGSATAASNQTATTGNQSVTISGPERLMTTGIAPDLLVNPTAPCRVAVGASAGWLGGAFGLSGSVMDEGCDAREDSRLLYNMGMKDEAIMRLCAKPEMATALGVNKCPKKEEPAPMPPVGS